MAVPQRFSITVKTVGGRGVGGTRFAYVILGAWGFVTARSFPQWCGQLNTLTKDTEVRREIECWKVVDLYAQ